MARLQLIVYFPTNEEPKYLMTENINWLSNPYRQNSYVLTPPLPCDEIFALYKNLSLKEYKRKRLLKIIPRKYKQHFLSKSHNLGFPGFPITLKNIPYYKSGLNEEEQQNLLTQINQVLIGRIIEDRHLDTVLRNQGWWPSEIFRALENGFRNGIYKFYPGIIKEPWGVYRCMRCNSLVTQFKPCWRCARAACAYCDTCHGLGEIQGCSRLWVLSDQKNKLAAYPKRAVKLQLAYNLTAAQNKASQKLVDFLSTEKQQILVWAACGAGKTEVSFKAIQTILQIGGQVLFAVPRRDVVLELSERLRDNFPDTSLAVHYGGQPWQAQGQLVVATTHQALRFYRRFSLVILDESDAFPYHGNEMLRFAIQRGKKAEGKVIEMTATPIHIPEKNHYVTIPARYHGYPLPVPSFLKMTLPHWEKIFEESLPLDILTRFLEIDAPWLVFVPTIKASKLVGTYLKNELKISVCFCHAADPERDQKKEGISSGKYQIMVTTSIMERGITIPNVQVMVLYCDHPVFSTNSLIQMAGRVGRNQLFPKGQVLFIGNKFTHETRMAISRIKFLNNQARKENLLREDD